MASYGITAAFIAILFVAIAKFGRYRRSLPIHAEWKLAKSRLPRWVRILEACVLLTFAFVLTTILLVVVLIAAAVLGRAQPISGAIILLIPLACFVASVGPAALLANAVSMSVPALRQANANAFSNLPIASVQLANKNLLQVSAVLIPYGLAFALLGLFWPS